MYLLIVRRRLACRRRSRRKIEWRLGGVSQMVLVPDEGVRRSRTCNPPKAFLRSKFRERCSDANSGLRSISRVRLGAPFLVKSYTDCPSSQDDVRKPRDLCAV